MSLNPALFASNENRIIHSLHSINTCISSQCLSSESGTREKYNFLACVSFTGSVSTRDWKFAGSTSTGDEQKLNVPRKVERIKKSRGVQYPCSSID